MLSEALYLLFSQPFFSCCLWWQQTKRTTQDILSPHGGIPRESKASWDTYCNPCSMFAGGRFSNMLLCSHYPKLIAMGEGQEATVDHHQTRPLHFYKIAAPAWRNLDAWNPSLGQNLYSWRKNISFILILNSTASFLPLIQSLPAALSLPHYPPLLPVPLLVFVIMIAQHLDTEGAL